MAGVLTALSGVLAETGAPPAAEEFDVIVLFDNGAVDSALTAAKLNLGTHGADWGAWQEAHNGVTDDPNDHSFIKNLSVKFPFQIDVGGDLYDGSEGQGMIFDHTGNPQLYDTFVMQFDPKPAELLACLLVKIDSENGVWNNDLFHVQGANYTVPQVHRGDSGFIEVTCHTEDGLGLGVPLELDEWYLVTVRHTDALGQILFHKIVQDGDDWVLDDIAGYSESAHDPVAGNEVNYIKFQDYLRIVTAGEGSTSLAPFVFREDVTFPYDLTVPPATDVEAEQLDDNEVTLTWSGPHAVWHVERNKNSGGWTTLAAAQVVKTYLDLDVADGDSVIYRVTPSMMGIAGATVSSNSVTVDNPAFVEFFNEGFEGAGTPANWIITGDPDDTSDPLVGAQSCLLESGEFALRHSFTSSLRAGAKFRLKIVSLPASGVAFASIGSDSTAAVTLSIFADGHFELGSTPVQLISDAGVFAEDVEYDVWLQYNGANGKVGATVGLAGEPKEDGETVLSRASSITFNVTQLFLICGDGLEVIVDTAQAGNGPYA